MVKGKLQLDDIDRSIIQYIQEEPSLTYTQIAKKIKRSQPTVGARIRKLEDAGLINYQAGVNLKTIGLYAANVFISSTNSEEIENLVKRCPYMLNGFKQSGDYNYLIIMVAHKLDHLDQIVNHHFRNNPDVLSVEMNVITNVISDFIIPIHLDLDNCDNGRKNVCCGKCFDSDKGKHFLVE